ncbi:MAG: phosphate acyltransferase PlsX [Deltaproteobacteria bacterium]|nr:phosphate acyltransferase PlsX [Deltaproteobacteria bacterium]
MRLALDAMGGDRGPAAMVEGAALALAEGPADLEIVLVGRPEELEPLMERAGAPAGRLTLHPATEVAGMDQAPSHILRRLKDSSIRVAFDLMKAGEAAAVVSAGNSGATMAVGMVVLGRLPEVERPALASVFPGLHGPIVVLDVGANVDCTPSMLLQFAYMGSAYAERVLGQANPTVGLLSIGEEDSKGNHVVKEAHENLKASGLNFIGNVEGRDLFDGPARVVVCDGFVGNVCLKLSEGLAQALEHLFRERIKTSVLGQMGALLLKPLLKDLALQMDYATYGGAPLLGINGAAFICHGASSSRAIASALKTAAHSVEGELTRHLREGMAQYRDLMLGEAD